MHNLFLRPFSQNLSVLLMSVDHISCCATCFKLETLVSRGPGKNEQNARSEDRDQAGVSAVGETEGDNISRRRRSDKSGQTGRQG